MKRTAAIVASAFLAWTAQHAAVSAQQAECSVAAIQAKAAKGTTITAAQLVPAADKTPAH